MSLGLHELPRRTVRESRASCGCAFVHVFRQFLDAREARWLSDMEMVVVPCRVEEHAGLAVAVALAESDPERAAKAMNERLAA